MCGIVGCIGKINVVPAVIAGLEKLEYRGYDSSGIACLFEELSVYKDIGKVAHLKQLLPQSLRAPCAIGHTRWATHGGVTKQNAHPHLSYSGSFCIVHNGIIENSDLLKKSFLAQIPSRSETDSEVIADLLDSLCEGDVLSSLQRLRALLRGSYATAILHKEEPEKLFFMKQQTPLLIGMGKDLACVASDTLAFPEGIDRYCVLKDGDYGFIGVRAYALYDAKQQEKAPEWIPIASQEEDIGTDGFEHHMMKEIYDQPGVVEKLLRAYYDPEHDRVLFPDPIRDLVNTCDHLYIVACGSSYYASLLGKHYLEQASQRQVSVLLASECIFSLPPLSAHPCFLFVSQSGETLDVIHVVKQCKERSLPTVCLTNVPHSTLDYLCDERLYLQAGREIAVASTKAFFAQSLVFFLIAQNLNRTVPDLKKHFAELESAIREILSKKETIHDLAKKIASKEKVFFLGRGIDYFLALEAALKLKEISYIHAEAFPGGELKHGPIALVDSHTAIIGIATQPRSASSLRMNLKETESRNGETYLLTVTPLQQKGDTLVAKDILPEFRPLELLVVVQLLAYYASLIKGNDIDQPRNLAKSVTVD